MNNNIYRKVTAAFVAKLGCNIKNTHLNSLLHALGRTLYVGVAYGVTSVMVSRKATLGLPVTHGQLYSDLRRYRNKTVEHDTETVSVPHKPQTLTDKGSSQTNNVC